jgi:hypothetical protein
MRNLIECPHCRAYYEIFDDEIIQICPYCEEIHLEMIEEEVELIWN